MAGTTVSGPALLCSIFSVAQRRSTVPKHGQNACLQMFSAVSPPLLACASSLGVVSFLQYTCVDSTLVPYEP